MITDATHIQETHLCVKGLQLAALRYGESGGRRVLALHGWLDNAQSFAVLAPRLAGCEVVALDFPGHGRSEHRPAGVLYHFSDYVSDVIGALDALDWSRVTLLGHSMGAGVASLVAAAAPERVERLILIEGLGSMPGDPARATERLSESCRGVLEPVRPPQRRFDNPGQAVAVRRKATPGIGADVLASLVARNLIPVDDGYGWSSDHRLRVSSAQPYDEPSIRALLGSIRAPSLLIEARGGFFADKLMLRERLALLKDAEHTLIDGSHHLHTGASVTEVATAINAFLLRELPGDRAGD